MKNAALPHLAAAFLLAAPLATARANVLSASDAATADYFGSAVSLSGSTALVGAWGDKDGGTNSGSAYLFRSLDTATGSVTQSAKLTASDDDANAYFGSAVSVSGFTALVGAWGDLGGDGSGSAYLFRSLDTATGTIHESAKLTGSNTAAFGSSVSLSGSIGLIGAYGDSAGGTDSGAAYLFRGLDTATGTITQSSAKLTASDAAAGDSFGSFVILSGSTGLVGAYGDSGGGTNSGSAYLFRSLDTATGSVTQSAKLTASDAAAGDYFGYSMSLSGSAGLVGAFGDDDGSSTTNSGSAYLFRSLDTATGTIHESAKLTASDAAAGDYFGYSVSLSGSTGIVGAYIDSDSGYSSGSAYLFRGLDTATGTIHESVKIVASNASMNDDFGKAVSVDGDLFLIGSPGFNTSTGKAYAGSVASLTTLDAGSSALIISRISFTSREDWIIGETTDSNQVTLASGSTAKVTASGKAVYIGQTAGSDDNTLIIAGVATANEVYIGSTAGNTGNTLQMEPTANGTATALRLAYGNKLRIGMNLGTIANLLTYLTTAPLQIWKDSQWVTVNAANASTLISMSASNGYTTVESLVKPSTPTPAGSPTVVVSGKKKITTKKSSITLKGTATNAAHVEVKVGKAKYKAAKGQSSWRFTARVKPGRTKILVRAVGSTGQTSPVAAITVTRK